MVVDEDYGGLPESEIAFYGHALLAMPLLPFLLLATATCTTFTNTFVLQVKLFSIISLKAKVTLSPLIVNPPLTNNLSHNLPQPQTTTNTQP